MKPVIFFAIAACLVAGCSKPPVSAAPEYTNSFAGEINQRVLTVQYGYAAGYARALVEEEQEKMGNSITNGLYASSGPDTKADVVSKTIANFWYLQTNSAARARVNGDQ
jgi:hypothetical protein